MTPVSGSVGSKAGRPIGVTVWNEYIHERYVDRAKAVYPEGIHTTIAKALTEKLGAGATVRTATQDQPAHGLTPDVLASTDVLLWWAHLIHDQVDDEIVDAVQARVLQGMGLIVLHSGHLAKPLRRLLGTSCSLRWREADDRELVWNVNPGHPITEGIGTHFAIPHHEMYGEYFDIPAPDELVFISSFTGGEVFRSGCCWRRGKGKLFYFSPGHETYPVYYQPEVQQVLANAVRWAHSPVVSDVVVADCPEAPSGWFEDDYVPAPEPTS